MALASGYNVRRSITSGSGYVTIASSVASANYTDTQATNGTTFYYVVSSTNAVGESANSAEVSATPQVSVPAAPTGLNVSAGNAQVALTWFPAATATGYNVKRSLASGGSYTTIAGTIIATNYTDTQVTNGTTYYYVVSALNAGGEGANSTEVSATPQPAQTSVVTTNIFKDMLTASRTVNSVSPAAPTATNTSYEVISSKSWSPTPSIGSGHLKFGIASTSSGCIEAQALFATNVVTLVNTNDSISLMVIFTNTTGLLAQTNVLDFGLYASGGSYPVAGGLNGTATSGNTANAAGGAQKWVGYVGQLSFTNAASQIITRPAQVNGTLVNSDQDVLTTGSNTSSFTNNPAVTVGSASAAASLVVAAGNPCTEVLTITLVGNNTLAITNYFYSGIGTNSTPLSQFGAVASGATFLTNSFDALAIGWRATTGGSATAIDINSISIISTLMTGAGQSAAPAAPTNLVATPGNALVTLTWSSVAAATEYNVKRSTIDGSGYSTVDSGVTMTNFSDTQVANGVTYYYVVSAANATGESTNSAQVSAMPLPPAPANLTASGTNLLINLQWNSVASASSYNLKRGTDNGGPYLTVIGGLTATNYADDDVTNAVTYYYVVSAQAGDGESTNSPQVSAVPLPSILPVNVSMQVVGDQLQLSWPQDHLGWRLQIQTNDLNSGIGTNWVEVLNSTNLTQFTLPVSPTNGSLFLRLIYP